MNDFLFINVLQIYINKKFKTRKTISFFKIYIFLTFLYCSCSVIYDLHPQDEPCPQNDR